MHENTVTIWSHGTTARPEWAAPHPESITHPDTYVYGGEPYWIKGAEHLVDYILLCHMHGKSVLIHVGG